MSVQRHWCRAGQRGLSGLVATALLASAAGIADDRFRSIDVFDLEFAGDPQIAPDGRQVAYVRNSNDIMTDRTRGRLWLVDRDGGRHRALIDDDRDMSSPRWSPDGGRIAFVAASDRGREILVYRFDTGRVSRIAELRESPSFLTWSPDGRQLAFTMLVPAPPDPLANPPGMPAGASWAPPVTQIEHTLYRADGGGYLKAGYRQIFVVPADGGAPAQLTDGPYLHEGGLSFMPDGRSIVFAANRAERWELDHDEREIYVLSLADGSVLQLTDRDGPDTAPAVSPDGKTIAFVGNDEHGRGYENVRLHVMNADGSGLRVLTADFDRAVRNPQWVGNGRGLVVDFADRGIFRLAYVDLAGRVTTWDHKVSGIYTGRPYADGSFSVAQDGTYAYTHGTASRPADVAIGRNGGGERVLTGLNEDLLGRRRLATVEAVQWRSSADGLEIDGWIAYPPDYEPGRAYPTILEIHGGPYEAYGPNFGTEIQRYCAEGYVVLYANPRGSLGYGAEFAHLNQHDYPGKDYDDLMSGVDLLVERGIADPDQLYLTGGSGGGTLTAWIVGKTGRFRAAVAAKPIVNWTSFALTTDIYTYFRVHWFPSHPWDDPEHFWKVSPLSLVGNVTTPTALMTGEDDHRTPITEAEQFYQALNLRGVDTALIRIPGASHLIMLRPSHQIAKVDNIIGWFRRHERD